MRKAAALAKKVLITVLAGILLINLYLVAAQLFFHQELPKLMGLAQIIVVSGSMEPAVEVGDLLVIREQDSYKVGDIVTYRSGGSLITHRVIRVEGTSLLAKGDANNVEDAPVDLEQIEGRMVLRVPKLGYAVLFLRTSRGIILTVFAGLLLILAPIFADWRKKPGGDDSGEI